MISKNKGRLFGCLNLKMFEKSIKVVFFVEIHRASTQIQIYWSFTVKNYGLCMVLARDDETNQWK